MFYTDFSQPFVSFLNLKVLCLHEVFSLKLNLFSVNQTSKPLLPGTASPTQRKIDSFIKLPFVTH